MLETKKDEEAKEDMVFGPENVVGAAGASVDVCPD